MPGQSITKAIPISQSYMKVSIAALLSEARHTFTCIGKENELINSLSRSKPTGEIWER